MNAVSPLTIEFIERRPLTAIKVVAAMDPADAATLFETLPTRHGVSLFASISPWSASVIVAEMDATAGAAILSELDYQSTASIVRMLPEADRQRLLEQLPRTMSRDLRGTLRFPADTVGAKMSTSIIALTADGTVAEAVTELRRIKRVKTGVVFVVDQGRRLLGAVSADELLQRSGEAGLGEVMDGSIEAISARARLSTVKSHPAWDEYAHMPVVNRQKILIGALARRTFRQSGVETRPGRAEPEMATVTGAMAGAFLSSGIELARILLGVETGTAEEPSSQPAAGDRS